MESYLHWQKTADSGGLLFLEFSSIALHVQNVFTVRAERRGQVPFSMAIENGELLQEFLPNTCAWDQQDLNKTMKKRKVRRE